MAILVGCIIGLVLGLTGAGGSVFAVPLLIIFLSLPAQQAIGLSLGAVALSALLGVFTKLKSGDIQWLPAMVYSVIGSLVAPLGNWANRQIDETLLMLGFSVLVVVVAVRMWLQATKQPQHTTVVRAGILSQEPSAIAICRMNKGAPFRIGLPCVMGVSAGAMLTGLLSGLFGVGGGFLIVPTLLFLTGISIRQAVATSLVVITAISASGFISFSLSGSNVDLHLLALVASGGMMGMIAGVFTSKYLASPTLQKIFAVLMLLIAAITLITQVLN
ncbi:MAG: sulfite exporter TauE/SafE family protein [Pseudomonadales bacterium]|nr:sulfite exporter TauE/SafE family protein [Pseudomonadales bacterium]